MKSNHWRLCLYDAFFWKIKQREKRRRRGLRGLASVRFDRTGRTNGKNGRSCHSFDMGRTVGKNGHCSAHDGTGAEGQIGFSQFNEPVICDAGVDDDFLDGFVAGLRPHVTKCDAGLLFDGRHQGHEMLVSGRQLWRWSDYGKRRSWGDLQSIRPSPAGRPVLWEHRTAPLMMRGTNDETYTSITGSHRNAGCQDDAEGKVNLGKNRTACFRDQRCGDTATLLFPSTLQVINRELRTAKNTAKNRMQPFQDIMTQKTPKFRWYRVRVYAIVSPAICK